MGIVNGAGRAEPAGAVSVAWLADAGPRDKNQNRAVAHLYDDGAWLIAVADGIGGILAILRRTAMAYSRHCPTSAQRVSWL